MTVTEKLGALGSWSVQLTEDTPEEVKARLDYFGHVALVRGRVNPADHGDTLLRAARYVGVLRRRQGEQESELSGSGMVFWLGDEDDKGAVLENPVNLTGKTLPECVAAVLPAAVQLGLVLDPGGTYTGTHQWQTPRQALQVICDAFGVEFRVNGDATVDVGTQAQLYATTPTGLVMRRGAGSDLDLSALSGRFEPDTSVIDYSTRVVLLGRTQDDGAIATGSAELDTVQYVDLHGNPVKFVRMISESDQTEGSVAARAQLQLNRFARVGRSLKVTAERYETDGTFAVGDNAYVYDPDTGIVSPDYEVTFRGQVLHPDVVRIAGVTWPVTEDHTVAFRTQAGEWIDLTRWVVWETGDNELTLGDLPRSLLGGGGNPVLDRTATPVDTIPPEPPTGLTLSSFTAMGADGHEAGFIDAAWTAPTLNVDGSVLTDLSHYLVAWKWSPGLQWQYATVADTQATLQAVVGLPFDVYVGAYDRSNNFSGWTAPESITVAADSTPPPSPADPTVTDYLMQLRIAYAGVDASGNPMPSDTSRVDVEVAPAATGPWEVVWSLAPFVPGVAYATAPTDAATFVRLVAYDHTGNASTPSGVVSGTTSKIVGDDILDGAVGTAKLADLAVVTAKIGELDLNNGRVGNLNVGKLLGGTLDAGVVIGGSLSTTPLPSGQHVAITSDAIEAWADTTTQTMRLDGVANLLTGTFQTDLTGRRIVLGAVGNEGTLDFYSPAGDHGFVTVYTESLGVEAMQFGLEMPGTNLLWNRININSDEWTNFRANKLDLYFGTGDGYFIVRGTSDKGATSAITRLQVDGNSFLVSDPSANTRLQVDAGQVGAYDDTGLDRLIVGNTGIGAKYWTDGEFRITERGRSNGVEAAKLIMNASGLTFYKGMGQDWSVYERQPGGSIVNSRFKITDTDVKFEWYNTPTKVALIPTSALASMGAGGANTSPGIQVIGPQGWGAILRSYNDPDGSNVRLEVRRSDNAIAIPIYASAFTQGSSAKGKTDVADLTFDPMERLRVAKVKSFRRLRPQDVDGNQPPPGRTEYGWIAEEAPQEVVVRNDGDVYGLDVGSEIGLLIAAVQSLDGRLAALENERKGAA